MLREPEAFPEGSRRCATRRFAPIPFVFFKATFTVIFFRIEVKPNWKKPQRGDATKTPEAGRNRRPKGHFFSSRPVTWCILVIRSLIAFICLHICGFTFPKNYESRLNAVQVA